MELKGNGLIQLGIPSFKINPNLQKNWKNSKYCSFVNWLVYALVKLGEKLCFLCFLHDFVFLLKIDAFSFDEFNIEKFSFSMIYFFSGKSQLFQEIRKGKTRGWKKYNDFHWFNEKTQLLWLLGSLKKRKITKHAKFPNFGYVSLGPYPTTFLRTLPFIPADKGVWWKASLPSNPFSSWTG